MPKHCTKSYDEHAHLYYKHDTSSSGTLLQQAYLQEDPVNVFLQHTSVQVSEAVQHPGLLIVSKILDGQVVAQSIAGLRND